MNCPPHPLPPPSLTDDQIVVHLGRARASGRNRAPYILHAPGAEMNRVVNFLLRGSYMRPHLHPEPEAIERILVMRGSLAVVFFDDHGAVNRIVPLKTGAAVDIPARSWHTYVVVTDVAITYETMTGVYNPVTWKTFGVWAPAEDAPQAASYLASLEQVVASQA